MNLESICLVCLISLCILFFRHYQHARSYATFIRPLSVFYLLLFIWMFYNCTIYYAVKSYSHFILKWLFPLDLCIAPWINPALYYYVYRLLSPSPPNGRQIVGHSIYPALAMTCMLYFIFQSPRVRELSFLSDCFDRPPLICLLRIGLCIQTIIYGFLIRQLLRTLRQQQFQISIKGTLINVRWLWYFIVPGILCVVGHGLFCFLYNSSMLHLQIRLILFCICVVWLLLQSISITGYPALLPSVQQNSKAKMEKKISSTEVVQMLHRLRELVETEKLYLQPDCHLDQLAEKLNINKSILSYVLNYHGEGGFTVFLHQFRIDHALQLIHQEAYLQHTVEIIAYDSGYASVATFRREFKKRQGITPGEYIAQHRLRGVRSDDA